MKKIKSMGEIYIDNELIYSNMMGMNMVYQIIQLCLLNLLMMKMTK